MSLSQVRRYRKHAVIDRRKIFSIRAVEVNGNLEGFSFAKMVIR